MERFNMMFQIDSLWNTCLLVTIVSLIIFMFYFIPLLKEVTLAVKDFRCTLKSIQELSQTSDEIAKRVDSTLEEVEVFKSKLTFLGNGIVDKAVSILMNDDKQA